MSTSHNEIPMQNKHTACIFQWIMIPCCPSGRTVALQTAKEYGMNPDWQLGMDTTCWLPNWLAENDASTLRADSCAICVVQLFWCPFILTLVGSLCSCLSFNSFRELLLGYNLKSNLILSRIILDLSFEAKIARFWQHFLVRLCASGKFEKVQNI